LADGEPFIKKARRSDSWEARGPVQNEGVGPHRVKTERSVQSLEGPRARSKLAILEHFSARGKRRGVIENQKGRRSQQPLRQYSSRGGSS